MPIFRFVNRSMSAAILVVLAAAFAWPGRDALPHLAFKLSDAGFEILHAAKQTAFALASGVAAVAGVLADALSALTAGLS